MKQIVTTLIIFIFLLNAATSQTAHPFELGFNGGAAWLKSDVKREKLGLGLGLTFGQTYCMNNTSPLLWGWRFRYLNANTYGQDSKKSYGIANNHVLNGDSDSLLDYYHHDTYVYQNYKTHIDEVSVEVLLGSNRIRQRTNLYPYIFGGAGLVKAVARTNQLDDNNQRYDYANMIDTNGTASNSEVLSQLKGIRDGSYETLADGNTSPRWKFMPSLGVGLGFEVVKGFSIGLEHKMTWAFHDVLDGQRWSGNNSPTGNNDMYHYTSFYLKFSFGRGGHGSGSTGNTTTTNTTGSNYTAPAAAAPAISFTNPSSSPFTTSSAMQTISGTVSNISSVNDIRMTQNGLRVNGFSYNSGTHEFNYPATLESGANTFVVTATNAAGSVNANTTVVYSQPVATPAPEMPPVVTFTSPVASPYTTTAPGATVSGTVSNITARSQVQVTVNGAPFSGFSYSASSHVFNMNLSLIPGANTVLVSASNGAGNDSKTATLIYKQEAAQSVPAPVVTITSPSANPFSTTMSSAGITANVQNITAAGQIQVTLNNGPVPASRLHYNTASHQLTFNVPLIQGANTIVVSATNVSGSDSKTETIIYTEPVQQSPAPVVSITNPAANPFNTTASSATVNAMVMNITAASQISVLLNGGPIPASALNYNLSSHQLTFSVNLVQGANTVVVSATNVSGSDSKTETIIYTQPAVSPAPVITITTPNASPFAATSASAALNATVMNVTAASQITVSLNGAATSAFTFNAATHQLSMTASLIPGSNTITITAANAGGSDSKTQVINYTVQVLPPVVSFITPASGSASSAVPTFAITAKATNVLNASQLSVKVNGSPVTGFTFMALTKKISFTASLIPGNNSIMITATNTAGTDSKTATINYTKAAEAVTNTNPDTTISLGRPGGAGSISLPGAGGTTGTETEAPVITPVNPASTPFTTSSASFAVVMKVEHVAGASAINVKINGADMTGFSFDAGTKMLTIPLTLVMGSNTVMVTAVNNVGEKRQKATIMKQ
ncbi:MAG: hypothetical protein JWO09_808 [Bacteroidetes bacterium]|nr:hypothetical protein [Bacteroidota bacterium]